MKVYLLYGNNGEMYEDYYEWIEGVYIDKEKARKQKDKLTRKAKQDYKKGIDWEERKYWIKEYEVIE